ncbi:hypothetical protein HKBW3S09_01483, partial [Candidatus Hakubella thermalkaliphila]
MTPRIASAHLGNGPAIIYLNTYALTAIAFVIVF